MYGGDRMWVINIHIDLNDDLQGEDAKYWLANEAEGNTRLSTSRRVYSGQKGK